MLFIAKLLNEFWAKTLEASIYIYNRILYLSLNFITPFENPLLKSIKIWGSITYNKIKGAKKLSPKAKLNLLID